MHNRDAQPNVTCLHFLEEKLRPNIYWHLQNLVLQRPSSVSSGSALAKTACQISKTTANTAGPGREAVLSDGRHGIFFAPARIVDDQGSMNTRKR